MKKIVWNWFTLIDGKLKFPYLKNDKIGIQLGFDMNYPSTSDLFSMEKRINNKGLIIGIDPDPINHGIAQPIINTNKLPIQLIQKGTYSKKDSLQLIYGNERSWNQLETIPMDDSVGFTSKKIEVEVNTLDNIIEELKVNTSKIAHINLTINGAEYDTLLGMKNTLTSCKNLSLTIIAGRPELSGVINGKDDYKVIIEYLNQFGFQSKFKRINQLFWWGFVTKLLFNREWIYSKKNFGIIMAGKGSQPLKWYQSFS